MGEGACEDAAGEEPAWEGPCEEAAGAEHAWKRPCEESAGAEPAWPTWEGPGEKVSGAEPAWEGPGEEATGAEPAWEEEAAGAEPAWEGPCDCEGAAGAEPAWEGSVEEGLPARPQVQVAGRYPTLPAGSRVRQSQRGKTVERGGGPSLTGPMVVVGSADKAEEAMSSTGVLRIG